MIVVNLDRLLSERKMQSVELAREIERTVQTVSRIKTGKMRAMRFTMLDALCEKLDCQPGDLLEYMSEEEAAHRFGESFVSDYRKYHAGA